MVGYVQVYTGNGKGKTTAAFGLALRAAGAGIRVFIAQFAKGGQYSEIKALERFSDLITVRQYGEGGWVRDQPEEDAIRSARKGWEEIKQVVASGNFGVVILDEANIVTFFNLINVEDLLELIENKPTHVEIVITGRRADPRIIERADLVTEMKDIKHYYSKGVKARVGIEK